MHRRVPIVFAVLGSLAMLGASCSDASTASRPASVTTLGGSTTAAPETTGPTAGRCTGMPGATPGAGSIMSSEQRRDYLLALPPALDPNQPAPLIFSFHGSGSNKEEQAVYSQLADKGPRSGYVVVTPDGTGAPRGFSLGGPLDATLVADLVARLGSKICIDSSRVYAAGISNGSAFSAIVACEAPYRFAAVGLVAAEVPPGRCPADTLPSAIAFHGTADSTVPFGGGRVDSGKGLSAPGAFDAMSQWAAHNGCQADPVDEQVSPHVIRHSWPDCREGTAVDFYEIDGGGHTWPGSIDVTKLGLADLGPVTDEINATDLMLDFFDAHRLAP